MKELNELEKVMKSALKERLVAYQHMKELYKLIGDVKEILNRHLSEYNEWREKFETVDRELAMIDGRFKKVSLSDNKKNLNPLDKLSKEQILKIAKELEDKGANVS